MTHDQLRKLVWANSFAAFAARTYEPEEHGRMAGYPDGEYSHPARFDEETSAEFADRCLARFDEKFPEASSPA